jgi:hypothetical protein
MHGMQYGDTRMAGGIITAFDHAQMPVLLSILI